MELDHIFIHASKGAVEADLLSDFGLVEGTPNIHPGQGTACRRFFFHNMMIELLWIEDYEEVQNERTKPMQFFERLSASDSKVSPFGIGFRPSSNSETSAPFPIWKYKPIYLPEHLSFEVASETPLYEPMWFYIPFASRQDSSSKNTQPINHKINLKEVTAAKVTINNTSDISKTADIVNELSNLYVVQAEEDLLELEFDNGIEGSVHDFRPSIPLIFRW
jgi:hypothetical protein